MIQKKTKFDSDIDGKIEMIIILEMVGKISLPTMYFILFFCILWDYECSADWYNQYV